MRKVVARKGRRLGVEKGWKEGRNKDGVEIGQIGIEVDREREEIDVQKGNWDRER